MRFFKSFSLLHRRTKSDSAANYVISKPQISSRPHSAPNFGGVHATPAFPHSEILSSAVPCGSPVITSPIAVPAGAIPILTRPTLAAANARILELEAENNHLKVTTHAMATQFAALQAELLDARSDLYAELHKEQSRVRQTKADEEEVDRYEERLSQYDKFIRLMINIGQHAEPVFSRAHTALRAGEDADMALVDSIKEAAAKPDSPWASLISAVIGPRAPEQYVSALNLTLSVRKELRQCRKVVKFWKQLAQQDYGNADAITPSNSDISSIHELLPPQRQAAVNALLAKYPQSARLLNNGTEQKADPLPLSLDTVDEILTTYVVPNATTSTFPSVYDSTPTVHSTYILPPLASVSFKRELAASFSFNKHFSKQSPSKGQTRTILGVRNLNSPAVVNITPSGSWLSQGSVISAARLGKRKAAEDTLGTMSTEHSIGPVLRLPDPDPTECARDLFASALSASLLAVYEDRVRADAGNDSSESTDNTHWTRSAFEKFTFERPSSTDHSSIPGLGEQTTTSENQVPTLSDEWSAPNVDFSFVAETISTAPTTPSKTPEVTLSKSSRLPVLKSLRRLSPKMLKAEITKRIASPLVIKKKSTVLTASGSSATSTPMPSRLPLVAKATPKKFSGKGKENVLRRVAH